MRGSLLIMRGAMLAFGMCGCLSAAEIVGKVVEVDGDTIRIASDSDLKPRRGDQVEVYFQLDGVDDVAKVAMGKVTTIEQGHVTARLDDIQGKVQEGMSVRITVSATNSPDKPTPSAAAGNEITGTVTKVETKTIHISTPSGRTPKVGDSVVFCFKILGADEVLKSGSGTVTAVNEGNVVARIVDGFVLNGHSARISTSVSAQPRPEDRTAPQDDARTEMDPKSALRAIDDLGGKVTKLRDGRVYVVNFSDTEAGDKDLANLRPFRDVVFVSLDNTKTTDKGLRHLRHLRQLESLSLAGTKITDAGLVHVSGFARLEGLILRDTAITDKGLRHLSELKKLQLLDVGGTKVTSQGAERLQGTLPELKTTIGVKKPTEPSSLPPSGAKAPQEDVRTIPSLP